LALPIAVLASAWPTGGWSLLGLFGFPIVAVRAAQSRRRRGTPWSQAALYGLFCTLGKCPQAIGQLRYLIGRLAGRRSRLIEYKTPASTVG